ncbi:rCG38020 [Rattus norvegicus]|uniref:RCG38020 n=1 Tax=Rattus norvegicus TaxID=10116 RepID=A6IV21_RAT|nr:rCG38020 [Rattus norvegicus]
MKKTIRSLQNQEHLQKQKMLESQGSLEHIDNDSEKDKWENKMHASLNHLILCHSVLSKMIL